MKKNYIIILVLIFCTNLIQAQLPKGKYSDYFREGIFLIAEENYDMALKNFLEAYKLDSSSANINFNVGFCYLFSSIDKGQAERYLAKSVLGISKKYKIDEPTEKSAPPIALFYYAKALHFNYKFDEALEQYNNFNKNYAKDKDTKLEVANSIEQSTYAKDLVAVPINVKIESLGDSINSSYPDYSPVLSADESTLIFTTRRNTSTGGEKTPDGQYYEDIVISYKDQNGIWSAPKPIGPFVNSSGHEGSVNLSSDGQTLIVYKDDSGDGNVYYSNWDGRDWSSLQNFGSDINSKYWECHACLSADNNTLYFVSDRPGGYGGRDIYRCVKLPNGAWSKAMNLGPQINTKYDDDGPFMHPDGVTLLYASKGHQSMGGFDIFFATLGEDGKFSEPINMGYPINTPDDDVFFVTSPDGKRGYFSSAAAGGLGEKDIYKMFIPDSREKPLALFKGSIVPADGEKLPEDLEVVVTDKETGELIGRYRPRENGSFSTILAPSKNYNFSYQSKGQEFYNEDVFVTNEYVYQEIKKEINLDPVNLLGNVKTKNKALLLNLVVLNNIKDKKPVPDAKVTLKESASADMFVSVNEKGRKEGVVLTADRTYVVYAESQGKQSAVTRFNTNGVKVGKVITQVVYIDSTIQIVDNTSKPNVACGSPVKYKHRFAYNQNNVEDAKDWDILIDGIISKTKECNPTVKIMSSASQVPTKAFGGNNKKLASSRADKMEEKIKAAVTAKGGDASKIIFKKHAAVRGPIYEADFQNTKKYSPYQYVQVIAR